MKISVQSLFEDYEENTVSLSRDADAERIWEKTRAKLPGLKKRRPVGLVLIAAAAVAVLCGAAAIVHYAAVRDGAGSYIMPDTLRYDEENKKTILVDTPFEWNDPISFDTEGRTKGKVCGMRLGWLPEGWGTGYTQTAYDVIAQRDAEQAQSLPQAERELVVYTYDLFAVQDERKDYSVQCMSANTVAGCDFLCGGSRSREPSAPTMQHGSRRTGSVQVRAPMRRRSGPRSCFCCMTGRNSASSSSAPTGTMRNGSRNIWRSWRRLLTPRSPI